MPDAAHISKTLQQHIQKLRQAVTIPEWRHFMRTPKGELPARRLAAGQLPYSWSSADGAAVFQAPLELPEAVAGIPLTGTVLFLDVWMPIGAVVRVDGEVVAREASWMDTRAVPVRLMDRYQAGPSMALEIECNHSDGFGLFLSAGPRFERLDEVIFDLDLLDAQLRFTRVLIEQGEPAQPWEEAAACLDLAALQALDWPRWEASLAAARRYLSAYTPAARRYTVHLIGHSHIDMNWLWRFAETLDVCRRDFNTVESLMDEFPDFKFSQSQAAVYQAMQQQYPQVFQQIERRIRQDRWDVTAATWVEGDLNTAAGEALARHLLYSRRYMLQQFQRAPLVGWEPDTFGHPATVPQLWQKSGIPYYYSCRAGKENTPLFWWEAPDGSRLLAVSDPLGYGGDILPTPVIDGLLVFSKGAKSKQGLYVYGVGDHGGGATRRDLNNLRKLNAAEALPRLLPAKAEDFYQAVLAEGGDLPIVRDELNTVFEGCYTSHGDIKRLNRTIENQMLQSEAAVALAAALTAFKPGAALHQAWQTALFHQFHDILCGCAIGGTYAEATEKITQAVDLAQQEQQAALRALAGGIRHELKGKIITVFNLLGWQRSDVVRLPLVELDLQAGAVPAAFVDESGRRTPAQICGDQIVFIAHDVPAFGARLYRPLLEKGAAPTAPAAHSPDELLLENEALRLRVHPQVGSLVELTDKIAGRELLQKSQGFAVEGKVNYGGLNRFQIQWERPHSMSAWNIGEFTRTDYLLDGAEVRLVESGPLRSAIEVRRAFLHSSLVQKIILYQGLRRVDFETEVDWHERGGSDHDAPMLRVTFSPRLGATRACYETAFGAVERVADGREVPALRWADLSEINGGYGLSLLNDCKYGHHAHGNTLGLTLLRASYEPDRNPDEGLHRFTYSLFPHAGAWQPAGTLQQAAGLNQPLLALVTEAAGNQEGPLSAGVSWFDVTGSGVVSALKLAEDQPTGGRAVVARLFEVEGQVGSFQLHPAWRVERVEAVNPVEEALGEAEATAADALLPFEIKTLKLTGPA